MPFLKRPNPRRRVFLSLLSDIESGLRVAFSRWARENDQTQSGLAKILGVNRSVVHRRLTGRANLTIETIADLVWALGYCIRVEIFHPKDAGKNRNLALVPAEGASVPAIASAPISTQPTIGGTRLVYPLISPAGVAS